MHYILTGFRQDGGFRIFSFDRIEPSQPNTSRTSHTVRADIALAQKYEIRLQELPLLCRALLEQTTDAEGSSLTFTEEGMRLHQGQCVENRKLSQQRKKPVRRPVPPTAADPATSYWRSDAANKTVPIHLVQPPAKTVA
jgi:hypothetical protein